MASRTATRTDISPDRSDERVERLAYSVEEAAACLGLSRATLWRMIALGQLNPRRVGRRTLLLKVDLVAFLEALPK